VQTHYTGADGSRSSNRLRRHRAADERRRQHEYMYSINRHSGDIRLIVNFDIATIRTLITYSRRFGCRRAQSQLPGRRYQLRITVKKSTTAPCAPCSLFAGRKLRRNISSQLRLYQLVDQLTRVPGVGNVQGLRRASMRCALVKPDQLAKLQITVPDIISAVQKTEHGQSRGTGRRERSRADRNSLTLCGRQGRLQTPEESVRLSCAQNPDGSLCA